MSWDISSYNGQPEGLQADDVERDILATATSTGLPLDACEQCGRRAELFHNERLGIALCDRCDMAADLDAAAEAVRETERVRETETEPVTYTHLRVGGWGLRGPVTLMVEGDTVVVSKRDGTHKAERVGRILWSNDHLAIARIARR